MGCLEDLTLAPEKGYIAPWQHRDILEDVLPLGCIGELGTLGVDDIKADGTPKIADAGPLHNANPKPSPNSDSYRSQYPNSWLRSNATTSKSEHKVKHKPEPTILAQTLALNLTPSTRAVGIGPRLCR